MEAASGTRQGPLWSVVVPTYNRGSLLERCLVSVLAQTHREIEVIVVDDCSTDNTPNVVRQVGDNRIKYIRLSVNSGAANARNVGMRAARGRMLAFIDSDDEWAEEKIASCQGFAERWGRDEAWVGFHRLSVVGGNQVAIRPSLNSDPNSSSLSDFLLIDGFIQTSSIFGFRSTLSTVEFDVRYSYLEDWAWYLEHERRGTTMRYFPEILATHYADARPGRLSSSLNPIVAQDWFLEFKDDLSARAQAAFVLLRLAPALKQKRPIRARTLGISAAVKLIGDTRTIIRPLIALVLPEWIVRRHFAARAMLGSRKV